MLMFFMTFLLPAPKTTGQVIDQGKDCADQAAKEERPAEPLSKRSFRCVLSACKKADVGVGWAGVGKKSAYPTEKKNDRCSQPACDKQPHDTQRVTAIIFQTG
jgi:hypothetical protein